MLCVSFNTLKKISINVYLDISAIQKLHIKSMYIDVVVSEDYSNIMILNFIRFQWFI